MVYSGALARDDAELVCRLAPGLRPAALVEALEQHHGVLVGRELVDHERDVGHHLLGHAALLRLGAELNGREVGDRGSDDAPHGLDAQHFACEELERGGHVRPEESDPRVSFTLAAVL